MTHLRLVRTRPRTRVRPPAPRTTETTEPSRPLDPPLRAAGLLGRIIDVFDAIEGASDQALERVRGLLVNELDEGRVTGIRAPHERRRRNAVLMAAATCIQAESEHRSVRRYRTAAGGFAWSADNVRTTEEHPAEATKLLYRVRRVLDGIDGFEESAPAARPAEVADVLAHMLRGPEPRTWSRDRRDFARCVAEWVRNPAR